MENERDKYIFPLVIKAHYVLNGKGVIVVQTREELIDAICSGIDLSPISKLEVSKC